YEGRQVEHRTVLLRRAGWAGYALAAIAGLIVVIALAWLLTVEQDLAAWWWYGTVLVGLVILVICGLAIYDGGFGSLYGLGRDRVRLLRPSVGVVHTPWGATAIALVAYTLYTPGIASPWRLDVRRNRMLHVHACLNAVFAVAV